MSKPACRPAIRRVTPLLAAGLALASAAALQAARFFPQEETFRVSRVNLPGSDETKPKLLELYEQINRDRAGGVYEAPAEIFRALGRHAYLVLVRGEIHHLTTLGRREYETGTILHAWVKKRGTYRYTTAEGTPLTVPRLVEVETPEHSLSKEVFVDYLKAGQIFRTTLHEDIQCKTCLGIGKIGSYVTGSKQICPTCEGERTVVLPVKYTVRW